MKVIRPELTADPFAGEEVERRFKRELVLARQVTHKHVVRIHDLGEINGIKYLTRPYVQGEDLAHLLKREGRLSVASALTLARQIIAGLGAAHEAGVVHRDLKPANIMVDIEGQAQIMDFGISRSTGGATISTGGRSGVVGTLEYMAPEQARAEPVDLRADIYAFGLMLYEMLVGRRSRASGESAIADLMERAQHAPPSVRSIDPQIPEAVDRIVTRCVQPDPAARFQKTHELAAELDRLNDYVLRPDTAPVAPASPLPCWSPISRTRRTTPCSTASSSRLSVCRSKPRRSSAPIHDGTPRARTM